MISTPVDAPELESDGSAKAIAETESKGRKAECMNPDHVGKKEFVYHVELLGGLCRTCYEFRQGRKVSNKGWKT